ncbi:CocE/NonD family hydrolase [Amycolatopsis endophytica]|uniref:Xaa-Pro dipeptidyl-peptidase C-terminal domain-containing protein n=1 Tax=Amycolatopsis endophytica TaxID=860233 RepID=A0A853B6C3_9PSEU|nr:CocE/NonD family hydrolase [Amycolatopsis endophytica]NYI90793.1 hypothetical protein [Amycolatopsis endophytica]
MNRIRTAVTAATVVLAGTLTALTSPAAADPVTHEENDHVPAGAAWTQHYFPSSDGSGVELHADVLLPEGLAEGEQVPVILSVGPYFGHSGQMNLEGRQRTGPSDRFDDFIEGTDLFERGYAFVMVDLRGFGGSTGCLDAGGAGDRADVKAALDWAASQPWSTGAVGMYGKSFDAITGLIGNNLGHDALRAVVAQEPVWDYYRNTRSDGVPRSTIVNVPNTYNLIATLPQLPDDDARYRANAEYEKAHPECPLANTLAYQTTDPRTEFWADRDYAAQAKGTGTPLFFTQGTLEWNTEPEAMQEFLDNHQGPERGWIGPWDHVRGNDRTEDGRLEMGRAGWFAETLSFYDQYLKGIGPRTAYPAYAVQDNTGTWRAQDTWPEAGAPTTVDLGSGSYVDHGGESATAASFLRCSAPVDRDIRVTGTPRLALTSAAHGNVMVELHDVAPDGTAVAFDEQVALLRPGATALDLKSAEWTLAAGHRLVVEIGTIQAGPLSDWIDTPSGETMEITDAALNLALDDPADDLPTDGGAAPYLDLYRQFSTSELPIGPPSFTLPTSGH